MRNTIKIERARYNLSQQELAEKLGITRQSIYAIESGKFIPSSLLALKMAKLFHIQVEELFILDDND